MVLTMQGLSVTNDVISRSCPAVKGLDFAWEEGLCPIRDCHIHVHVCFFPVCGFWWFNCVFNVRFLSSGNFLQSNSCSKSFTFFLLHSSFVDLINRFPQAGVPGSKNWEQKNEWDRVFFFFFSLSQWEFPVLLTGNKRMNKTCFFSFSPLMTQQKDS